MADISYSKMNGSGNHKKSPASWRLLCLEKYPRGRLLILVFLFAFMIYVVVRFRGPGLPFDVMSQETNFSKQPFPKIIHQVWLNYSKGPIPEDWQEATRTTRTLNPDWEYRVWSAKDVMDLLEKHHPWFIETYKNYRYNVERADASRYFIVHHYGGIYLDMDEFTQRPITEIIQEHKLDRYDCMLPEGTPSGVTNYVFLCKKGSPFLAHMTSRLRHYNGWYGIPYATVMWSTGPRFMSARYAEYKNKDTLYVLPGDKVKEYFGCLFGQSWFSLDGVILHVIVYPFIRLGVSWGFIFVAPLVILPCLLACYCCYARRCQAQNKTR